MNNEIINNIEKYFNKYPRYKENIEEIVTEKEIKEFNKIIDKLNNEEKIYKYEAKIIYEFNKKTRQCTACKRDIKEAKMWSHIEIKTKTHKKEPIDFHNKCTECEFKEIIIEEQQGLLK